MHKHLKGKRVLGVDPLRVNVFTVVEEKDDGSFKMYRLTRSRYYKQSGSHKAVRKSNLWNKIALKKELEVLSNNSPKAASLEAFERFVTAYDQHKEALWNEYFKKRWRHQTMDLYGGKKRTFAMFLNSLNDDGDQRDTVLAYGAAKFAPGGKGEVSVPTSRAFKECSYRYKTVHIDEFRTSRISHKDDSLLGGVGLKRSNSGEKQVSVRGLLWCSSTNNSKVGKFVNRDLNAAINIRRCAILPKRPIALDRAKSNEKLSIQRITKLIRF